jgi:hypothetical protein
MTSRPVLAFAAAGLAGALLVAAPTPAAGGGETSAPPPQTGWPWGAKGDGRGFRDKKDLYNLGILGAKATDADRAPPPEAGEGIRSVKMTADPSADRGPDRLRIEVLFPDGPAMKAGLKPGDVITGAAGKSFKDGKDGSIAPLAKALVDAESGATKGLSLSVERGGAKPSTTVVVQAPVVGKDAATPLRGKARVAVVNAALDWLAKRQQDDGGFETTLSGASGAVVQTSMAGLAWLAGGSDLAKGPNAARLKKAFTYVKGAAGSDGESPHGSGPNNDQTNWGIVHAAIFLGELDARSPDADVAAELKVLGDEIAKRQEGSGGWAHGPGGPNALGYVELNIMSGLAMMGMGAAKRAGWTPPDAVLAKARQYLEDSSGGDGGIGYSTKPGQKGQGNIGRTCATWMGYTALGLDHEKWTAKMAGYVKLHAGDVFGGHASLMQHFFLAGVASQALGGDAEKAYWSTCEANMVLARAPDGSFQPRPWHESLQMGSNSDVDFGEVWTTAAWAIVLAADGQKDGLPGLPATTGKLAPKGKGE